MLTFLHRSPAGIGAEELAKNTAVLQSIEELIDINHHLLNAIGVGHPSLDEVCKITRAQGLHSKLTGAGGGGCALSFIKPGTSEEQLRMVTAKLEEAGFQCFHTSIGVGGVCLHQSFGDTLERTSLTADQFALQAVKFHFNSK